MIILFTYNNFPILHSILIVISGFPVLLLPLKISRFITPVHIENKYLTFNKMKEFFYLKKILFKNFFIK